MTWRPALPLPPVTMIRTILCVSLGGIEGLVAGSTSILNGQYIYVAKLVPMLDRMLLRPLHHRSRSGDSSSTNADDLHLSYERRLAR